MQVFFLHLTTKTIVLQASIIEKLMNEGGAKNILQKPN